MSVISTIYLTASCLLSSIAGTPIFFNGSIFEGACGCQDWAFGKNMIDEVPFAKQCEMLSSASLASKNANPNQRRNKDGCQLVVPTRTPSM
mmetsp:Transcript_22446/g.57225  ORF Transcript_22446/g.57225 Transcript_22446/m.57225 type:complete len:91 (+) Transcript_22446:180-452(+)